MKGQSLKKWVEQNLVLNEFTFKVKATRNDMLAFALLAEKKGLVLR